MTDNSITKTNKRSVGRFGEEAALAFITGRGYNVLYKNFRFGRYGEIDIIAKKSGVICFIEVKTRSSAAFGTPAESVSRGKRRNIIAVANHFLRIFDFDGHKLRFDIIEVYYEKAGAPDVSRKINEIRHIENAFGAE